MLTVGVGKELCTECSRLKRLRERAIVDNRNVLSKIHSAVAQR